MNVTQSHSLMARRCYFLNGQWKWFKPAEQKTWILLAMNPIWFQLFKSMKISPSSIFLFE